MKSWVNEFVTMLEFSPLTELGRPSMVPLALTCQVWSNPNYTGTGVIDMKIFKHAFKCYMQK